MARGDRTGPCRRSRILRGAASGTTGDNSILGASQEIAKEFAQGQFQPLIVNISTACSVVGVFFSSNVMVGRMGDWGRIGFVATGNMVGYVLVGLAYSVAPWDRDPCRGTSRQRPVVPSLANRRTPVCL